MKALLLVLVLILSSGCFVILRAIGDDPRAAAVTQAAQKLVTCQQLLLEERDTDEAMQFSLHGCGRVLACRDSDNGWVCFDAPPRLGDFGDGWRERPPRGFSVVGAAVAQITGCDALDTRVFGLGGGSFAANNCGRDFVCEGEMDSVRREMTMIDAHCREDAASAARTARKEEEAEDRIAQKVATDRLRLETECPVEKINLVSKAEWTRGTERAYGFSACGKRFTCTTAAGRTDCKAGLEAAEAPAP